MGVIHNEHFLQRGDVDTLLLPIDDEVNVLLVVRLGRLEKPSRPAVRQDDVFGVLVLDVLAHGWNQKGLSSSPKGTSSMTSVAFAAAVPL